MSHHSPSLLVLLSLSLAAAGCSAVASPDVATGHATAAVNGASGFQYTEWDYANQPYGVYTSMATQLLVHEDSGNLSPQKAWGTEFIVCDTTKNNVPCSGVGGGFVTLQTDAVRSNGSRGKIASIFIQAAYGATPAGAGTSCRGADPEWASSGMECELDLDWTVGGLYRFNVDKVSSDEWRGSIVELGTANSWDIGTIRVAPSWGDLQGQLFSMSVEDFCDRVAAVYWSPLMGGTGAQGVSPTPPGSGSCSSVRNAVSSDHEYVIHSVGTGNGNPGAAPLPDSCGVMKPGEGLITSGSLTSCNGDYHFDLLGGGDLALYHGGTRIWSAGTTAGFVAVMQGDGNFVVYDDAGHAELATNTAGHSGSHLSVQDDGNVVIYDANNVAIWATGTNGK